MNLRLTKYNNNTGMGILQRRYTFMFWVIWVDVCFMTRTGFDECIPFED